MDLAARWRQEANRLRSLEAVGQAATLEAAASELEEANRNRALTVLSLSEAAAESGGNSEDHLGRLLREGTIPNAGEPYSPRIRRCDLPRKPGFRHQDVPRRCRADNFSGADRPSCRELRHGRPRWLEGKIHWSYSAGERGRNRVRAYEDAKTGILHLEFYEPAPDEAKPKRKALSLGHRDRERAKQQADELAAKFGRAEQELSGDITLRALFDIYGREVTPQKGERSQRYDRGGRGDVPPFLRSRAKGNEPQPT